jgi:hypothetical protein
MRIVVRVGVVLACSWCFCSLGLRWLTKQQWTVSPIHLASTSTSTSTSANTSNTNTNTKAAPSTTRRTCQSADVSKCTPSRLKRL